MGVPWYYTTVPPPEGEDLYEVIDGQRVWPREDLPDEDILYEVVNGQWQEIPHMGALAGTIASFLLTHINLFAWQHKLGFATTEVMFRLKPDRPQRRPDLAFIPYDRWRVPPEISDDPPCWDVVPTLAVEVVSPNNEAGKMLDKIIDYFDAGVQLVWVVYPRQQRIYVYTSPTTIRVLTAQDELDGGTVLPGFRLPIANLFAPITQPS